MVRPRLDYELDIIPTESRQNFQASEIVLGVMLLFAVMGLVLQLGCAIATAWNYRNRTEVAGDGIEVGQPLVYLGKVICIVGLKVLATTTNGLLAVKWVLAGEPANFALVASFVLVTVNTQLLVTTSQIAHLRDIVVKLAIGRQVRIQFSGIGNLLESGAGRTCVVVNGIAIGVLVLHLRERLWQLLPWLCTPIGILAWANAGLVGIGASAWKELKPFLLDKAPVKTVADFLGELGADASESQERHCCSFFSWASRASSLSSEDERLLKNRVVLIQNAFPTSPRLRLLHGLIVVISNMCSFAIPTMLIGVCISQVPQLQKIDIVGGENHPSLSPGASDYYIQLQDSWIQDISLKMELPLGQASIISFCCDSQCTNPQVTEYGSTLLLESRIQTHQFGTCNLNLNGMRFRQYKFTVLALRGCAMSAKLGNAAADFGGFQSGSHNYETAVVNSNLGAEAELVMLIKPELDTSNIKASYVLRGCANRTCEAWTDMETKPEIRVTQRSKDEAFNLTLRMELSPRSPTGPDLQQTYNFSVAVLGLKEELEKMIAVQMSFLRGEMDASEDFSLTNSSAKRRWQAAKQNRDKYLKIAYEAQKRQAPDPQFKDISVNFLAVGLTGTGKSELCRWMTGNEEKCVASNGTDSNTSELVEVSGVPFSDPYLRPLINWIDTPGRGDTRGEEEDARLWNETMSKLLSRHSTNHLNRIVWVINAAWQRGTEARQMILKELRKSFGFHLYRHLDLVFNFLSHGPSQIEYNKSVLQPQRLKYIEWIRKQEIAMFNWSEKLLPQIEAEINNTGFYGININPKYYWGQDTSDRPKEIPLSAPYLARFPPFSHPAGLSELIRLYENARHLAKNSSNALQLKERHPRLGPGKLEKVEVLGWRCGVAPKENDDSQMEFGPVAWRLKLTGEHFSEGDRAAVFPPKHTCGEHLHGSRWLERVGAPADLSASSDEHVAEYVLKDPDTPSSSKLCFCEATGCHEPWRFTQSKDIPRPDGAAQECRQNMKHEIEVQERAFNLYSGTQLILLGQDLVFLPCIFFCSGDDSPLPLAAAAVDLRTDAVHRQKYSMTYSNLPYSWCSNLFWKRASGNTSFYAVSNHNLQLKSSSNHVIWRLDVKSGTTLSVDVVNITGKTRGHHVWAVQAVGQTLYLIPSDSHGDFLVVTPGHDGSEPTVQRFFLEGPGKWREKLEPGRMRLSWFDLIEANGTLFASPFDAESMLVFHIHNMSLGQINTGVVQMGKPQKWTYLLEADGHLYAAPCGARNILVIDLESHSATGIDKLDQESCYGRLFRVGRHIFMADFPFQSHGPLVVDIDTHQARHLDQPAGSTAFYFHSQNLVTANGKVYAHKSLHRCKYIRESPVNCSEFEAVQILDLTHENSTKEAPAQAPALTTSVKPISAMT